MRKARSLRVIGLVFLITALLVSVLSVQAFAAEGIETAYLTVAGTSVTEDNKDDSLAMAVPCGRHTTRMQTR